jgi:hypothetical protein
MVTKTYGSISESDVIDSFMNPSNSSTNNPSLENTNGTNGTNGANTTVSSTQSDETYRLIQHPMDGNNARTEAHDHVRKAMSFEEALHQHVTGRHVRTRTLTLLLVVVVALIGSVLWYVKDPSHSVAHSTWKDSDLVPYGPSKKKNATRAPFSKLHPVRDMGMYDYPRPKSSVPARPLKEGLWNRTSYPTNSWYQSLLAPTEEPNDVHRTYAAPYVIDTSGPMPGLRLHSNHIDASSFVVQLYVINEYGLTLGAAMDASTSSTTHNINSDSPPTHQYKITHATALGVTLNWVSLTRRRSSGGTFIYCSSPSRYLPPILSFLFL